MYYMEINRPKESSNDMGEERHGEHGINMRQNEERRVIHEKKRKGKGEVI
jgi:hypothetical protein